MQATEQDFYRPVKQEKSGWRDETISTWHRKTGFHAPACDIDAIYTVNDIVDSGMWIEFNNLKPVAFVDYKHEYAEINPRQASIQTLRWVADNLKVPVPFLIVRYAGNFEWFEIIPENQAAIDKLRSMTNENGRSKIALHEAIHLSERAFVHVLYLLRDREVPTEFLSKFKG